MNSSTPGVLAASSSLFPPAKQSPGSVLEFSRTLFSSTGTEPGDGNSLSSGNPPGTRERGDFFTTQMVVMCVLAVTVMLGLVFLSCGLLRRSEGFVDLPGDERTSKDGGMC
ncbi:reprimo-like protein [Myripristis murdjan]|uniref:reprimo-like protein n=1 Tax=Myripristis murdjan TaxID=586833 RepID=UPI001175F427|nr:reprimo-like protein [Myripristis murdjan]